MVDYNLNPGVAVCAPWPCAESVVGMQGYLAPVHCYSETATEILAPHRREDPAKEVLSLFVLSIYPRLKSWLQSR